MAAPNEDGMMEVNNAYQPIINGQRNDPNWVLIPGKTYYISGNFWARALNGEPARDVHGTPTMGGRRALQNRKARAIGKYIPQQMHDLGQDFRISKLIISTPHPENYRADWEFDGNAAYMAEPYNVSFYDERRSETLANNIYEYRRVAIDADLHIYLPPGPGVSTAAQHRNAAQIQTEDRNDASIRNNSTTPMFPRLRPTEMQTLDLEQKTWLIDHNLQGLPFAEIQSRLSSRLADGGPSANLAAADWLAVDDESGTWKVKEDNYKGLMDRVAKGGRRRRRPTASRRRGKRNGRGSARKPRQKRTLKYTIRR
jgi:hypothetical protein